VAQAPSSCLGRAAGWMTDIVLESLRAVILAGILVVLWRHGGSPLASRVHPGWRRIMGGFGLILFGALLDITDNFPALARYEVIGETETEAWLEKLLGYTGGFLLLFSGFLRWSPAVNTRERQQARLMDAIARAQGTFIHTADTRQAFDDLLRDILDLTGSAYGFIGEVLQRDGQPYLKTHAITNIAWNAEARRFHDAHAPQGLGFTNLDTLFGAALRSREPVIANDPAQDPRRGGLPPGHPPLNAFLGLPIIAGDRMSGMLGIANRPGGYDDQMVVFLRPLASTIAQLIEARQAVRARAAIEFSHHRLALLASRTTNGVVIADPNGCVEWVNAGFERLTGYTLAEVQGHKPGHVLQGYGTDTATVEQMRSALRAGESFEVEVLNYAKNGQPYWINLSVDPMRDEAGALQGFIGIETDITPRKRAEDALAASAAHAQAVLNHVLDGIITIDGKGIIASFNLAAARTFGYSEEEVVGRNIKMLMPEPHRSRHDDYLRHYQAGGIPKVIGIGREVEGQRKDGSIFPMDLAVTRISREGRPLYIGMVRDITEGKRMERLKREFLSTVSHELRTPLTSIRGALGLIAGGAMGRLPEQVEHLVGIAHDNSEHLTRLINDLLDMEKIAANGMRFDLRAQAVMPLVEQAIEANRAYGEARQVSFILTTRADDAMVRVDAQRFLQIMANLLSNAAKFSPVGGQIEIAVNIREGFARVTVTDHGPGIPADFHDQVFDKFSQADASDGRHTGGTGLGLAITRELVQRMDGRIGFESREGEGATFHVEWPRSPDKAAMEHTHGTTA